MVGLQILKDLGLSRIRLLTNNPKKTNAFVYSGVNLTVVEQIPIIAPAEPERADYMATKRDKMGHRLPEEPPRREGRSSGPQPNPTNM
jgi:3,4-dihydroxy 2-butanone 4-phosphate synthase/GTP cyclohydrolase II